MSDTEYAAPVALIALRFSATGTGSPVTRSPVVSKGWRISVVPLMNNRAAGGAYFACRSVDMTNVLVIDSNDVTNTPFEPPSA